MKLKHTPVKIIIQSSRSSRLMAVIVFAMILLKITVIAGCAKKPEPAPADPSAVDTSSPDRQSRIYTNTATNPRDGAEMVMIPAGLFYQGAVDADAAASQWEKPGRMVFLKDYYIYKYEVTRRQFQRFADATGYKTVAERKCLKYTWRSNLRKETMDHPVVFMAYEDAAAYCRWAGGRLPTEAQWEKAARSDDRRIYPWGNTFDQSRFNSDLFKNYFLCIIPDINAEEYWEGYVSTDFSSSAGSYPRGVSPYGVHDMIGNAFEFCRDYFTPYRDGYQKLAFYEPVETVPVYPDRRRVIKGGGNCDELDAFRISARDFCKEGAAADDFGFRMVMTREEFEKVKKNPKGPENVALKAKDRTDAKTEKGVSPDDFDILYNPKDGALVFVTEVETRHAELDSASVKGRLDNRGRFRNKHGMPLHDKKGKQPFENLEVDNDSNNDVNHGVISLYGQCKRNTAGVYIRRVTKGQFARFINTTGYKGYKGDVSALMKDPDSPVLDVSIEDSRKYQEWIDGDYRKVSVYWKALIGTLKDYYPLVEKRLKNGSASGGDRWFDGERLEYSVSRKRNGRGFVVFVKPVLKK